MSRDEFIGSLIGSAIVFVIGAVIVPPRKHMWIKRAHKLAASSDIALPGLIADRVARFLRDEFLFGQLVTLLTLPPLVTVLAGDQAHRYWARWFPWILAGLPLYWAIVCFVLSLWPRWKASGGYRVTHLASLPVRQAFTPAELTAVIIGAVFGAAFGAWGLWYVAAPTTWWLVCAAAWAAAFAASHYAATSVMNRPSSASDEIELGWEDVLRFRQVRSITAAVAWAPTIFLYLIDWLMSSAFGRETTAHCAAGVCEVSYQVQLWPIFAPLVAGLLLSRVFRQGRQLWRRAWLERGGSG
jgi:hypothetical protein